MCPKSIILFFLLSIASALAQISPAFFGSFPASFASPFSDFASVGGSSFSSDGGARTNTGPILFPPAPESRDTSGVIVGASGYGFVPPGSSSPVPQRDLTSPTFPGFGFRHPYFQL